MKRTNFTRCKIQVARIGVIILVQGAYHYLWVVDHTQQHHPTFQLQWQVFGALLRCLHTAEELTVFGITKMLQCLFKAKWSPAFLPCPIEMAESIARSHETIASFKSKAIQVEPHLKKRAPTLHKSKNHIMKPDQTTINHQSLTIQKGVLSFCLVDFTGYWGHLVSRPCLQHTAGTALGRIKTCREGSPEVEWFSNLLNSYLTGSGDLGFPSHQDIANSSIQQVKSFLLKIKLKTWMNLSKLWCHFSILQELWIRGTDLTIIWPNEREKKENLSKTFKNILGKRGYESSLKSRPE